VDPHAKKLPSREKEMSLGQWLQWKFRRYLESWASQIRIAPGRVKANRERVGRNKDSSNG